MHSFKHLNMRFHSTDFNGIRSVGVHPENLGKLLKLDVRAITKTLMTP